VAELYRARVVRVDSDGVFVEVPDLGEGAEWGPLELLDIGLEVGDQVVVGSISGVMEDMVLLGKLVLEPPVAGSGYTPPANSSFVLYYENEAARTAASLTPTSGLTTWLDDEQRLDIYTDEPTAGYVSFYGEKNDTITYPAGVGASYTVDSSARTALSLTSTVDGTLPMVTATTADPNTPVLGSRVTGDSTNRLQVDADGLFTWGPGSGGGDTNLYRDAGNGLKTDDALTTVGNLTTNANLRALGTSRLDVAVGIAADAASDARLYIERDGATRRGLHIKNTGASGGLNTFFSETSAAAGASAGLLAGLVTGESFERYAVEHNGSMQWGDGAGAFDTNLFRGAASQLKTNDAFVADGGITSGAALTVTTGGAAITGNTAVTGNLTATGIGAVVHLVKTNTDSITSNAVHANDSQLNGMALAVGTWHIDVNMVVFGDAAADIATNWAFTGTYTGTKLVQGPGTANTANINAVTPLRLNGNNLGTAITYGTTGSSTYYVRETSVVTVTVAGNFSITRAQGASSLNAAGTSPGSFVICRRIA
jgi:hypothetical protein